ncbi:MAG: carbohydrate ABC transporter permease [Bifidobacteriaceae bacterium]|jgi:multiple sugar transport system permease protein|nr:carbohydrate ABC transporter permease [Bifidobacteriaceae bacterium]
MAISTFTPPAPDHLPAVTRRARPEMSVTAKVIVYVFLSVAAAGALSPLVWTIFNSLKPSIEVYGEPLELLSKNASLANYINALSDPVFLRYTINSIVVAVAQVVGNVVLSAMAGYALAKLEFPGRRIIFGAVLATFMIPGLMLFVPQFVTVASLGMVNTYPGIILPGLVSSFSIFIMRQFMLATPTELMEAARLDGAGEIRIFLTIAFPLATPALATVGIISFMASWNNLLWPLVVAQTQEMFTLPIFLAFQAQAQTVPDYGLMLAGSVVMIAPIVTLFVCFQRFFIAGIATTGIK